MTFTELSDVCVTGSCQQQNGGCSQLCFQKVTQSVCDCAIGYQLGDDGRSCNSGRLQHFLHKVNCLNN